MKNEPVVLAALAASIAGRAIAQTDALYYTDTGTHTLHQVQFGTDTAYAMPAASIDEMPIAVAGDVRTSGSRFDVSRRYSLAGSHTGPTFPRPPITADLLDGTTNGIHNFAMASDGWVYRFDRNWQSPAALFQPVSGGWGLTYDALTNSLWVSNGHLTVEQYAMSGGSPISSFTLLPGTFTENAIAWEPSTNTIWVIENYGGTTAQQYSTTGVPMMSVPLVGGIHPIGGAEFDMGPIPAPGAIGLLSAAGLIASRRRR